MITALLPDLFQYLFQRGVLHDQGYALGRSRALTCRQAASKMIAVKFISSKVLMKAEGERDLPDNAGVWQLKMHNFVLFRLNNVYPPMAESNPSNDCLRID